MIRFATARDLPAMLEIYRPYVEQTTYSFEYETPSLEEFARRFADHTTQFPWLVWEEGGEILGYAYASPPYSRAAYSWCAEPTIYLRPDAQGKGVARKLYAALEWLLDKQGYHVLYALICAENAPSLRFHEKCGFQKAVCFSDCGFKFGRWLGMTWMEKRLKTGEIPSTKPVPWMSIVENAENFANILGSLSLSYL